MPSPLAPDPIRAQSCVCCLYSEPIEIAWRYHLSFYLAHYPIRDKPYIGAISKRKYLLLYETRVFRKRKVVQEKDENQCYSAPKKAESSTEK